MKKVLVIGCGAYMDSGYGCPGEWRCLKAAALGEGTFEEPVQVIGLLKCQCPGKTTVPNLGVNMKMSEMKPDVVYLSSCLANSKPDCPTFGSPQTLADMIDAKFGLPVVMGTHDYH